MRDEMPIDEDEAMEQFKRILEDIFGPPELDRESWRHNAEAWFAEAFQQFQEDVMELMDQVPDIIDRDPDSLSFYEEAILDAWIDGRHYEVSISRVPEDEAEAPPEDEPTVRIPAEVTPDSEGSAVFDDDFIREWQ